MPEPWSSESVLLGMPYCVTAVGTCRADCLYCSENILQYESWVRVGDVDTSYRHTWLVLVFYVPFVPTFTHKTDSPSVQTLCGIIFNIIFNNNIFNNIM
jgi:hypothetical protein